MASHAGKTSFQHALASGDTAVITHLTTPSLTMAEFLAQTDYDGIVIDLQHGSLDLADVLPLTHAITANGTTPLARVTQLDRGQIGRVLDFGVRGIIVPMVESRAEVEALVAATSYPPMGERSYGPQRPKIYGDPASYGQANTGYGEVANQAITRIVQIETAAGLERAEEIMQTPGLDAIYIGPTDLGRALGQEFAADWQDGPVAEAIDRLLALGKQYGVGVGIYTVDPAYARAVADKGMAFVVLNGDLGLITIGAQRTLAQFRGEA